MSNSSIYHKQKGFARLTLSTAQQLTHTLALAPRRCGNEGALPLLWKGNKNQFLIPSNLGQLVAASKIEGKFHREHNENKEVWYLKTKQTDQTYQ